MIVTSLDCPHPKGRRDSIGLGDEHLPGTVDPKQFTLPRSVQYCTLSKQLRRKNRVERNPPLIRTEPACSNR
jgi:hypothetical protein